MPSMVIAIYRNLTFSYEPLAWLLQCGLAVLAARSWQESWADSGLHFDPDWERYQRMEDEGLMRLLAVRKKGELVGYASVLVGHNLHDRKALCAVVQDFFMAPEARGGFNGLKLFLVLETSLKALGVKQIALAERLDAFKERGGMGKFFSRLGMQCAEKIWTKTIN